MINSSPTRSRLEADRLKKQRSRTALLEAARDLFAQTGWSGTKVEDIARLAGVSPATAFNHFPTKFALMGHVFAPILEEVVDGETQSSSTFDALVRHVSDLSAAFRAKSNYPLTVAFTGAVQEYTSRGGGPPDPDDMNDPRTIVPIPMHLAELIGQAQASGYARTFPAAWDLATQVTNLLLLRCLSRPKESAGDSAEVVLTMLFGVLRPEVLVEAGREGRPFRSGASTDAF
ncbi:MAG TPA: TetR/AcrR family transcriptional regulator [Actinomycetota bacterium]|nr:TetR/AcrR family transcriptional regulator [Actinomycetota bacterium]